MSFFQRKENFALSLVKYFPKQISAMSLSLLRLFLALPLIWSLLLDKRILALIIFLIAAVLDYLDGPLARYRNQVTNAGKLLDPLADKFIAMPIVIILGQQFIPSWLIITIVSLEVALILLSSVLKYIFQKIGISRPLGANIFGKLKFSTQVIACLLMFILLPNYSINQLIIFWLFILAVALALASIIKHIAPSHD